MMTNSTGLNEVMTAGLQAKKKFAALQAFSERGELSWEWERWDKGELLGATPQSKRPKQKRSNSSPIVSSNSRETPRITTRHLSITEHEVNDFSAASTPTAKAKRLGDDDDANTTLDLDSLCTCSPSLPPALLHYNPRPTDEGRNFSLPLSSSEATFYSSPYYSSEASSASSLFLEAGSFDEKELPKPILELGGVGLEDVHVKEWIMKVNLRAEANGTEEWGRKHYD
ncbi:hypothetical protein BT69DRAFT_1290855 [Atractiella rhizophila]|nr:hypothetical protein BT69DRAFT_1290855 [Atractiella rhizophila]